jgi:hypothetical protein
MNIFSYKNFKINRRKIIKTKRNNKLKRGEILMLIKFKNRKQKL